MEASGGKPYAVSWEDRKGTLHIVHFSNEITAKAFACGVEFAGYQPITAYVPQDWTKAEVLSGNSD